MYQKSILSFDFAKYLISNKPGSVELVAVVASQDEFVCASEFRDLEKQEIRGEHAC